MPVNPNQSQSRIDTSNSEEIYIGSAPQSVLESEDKWRITKIVIDGPDIAITKTGSRAVWDLRLTEEYS